MWQPQQEALVQLIQLLTKSCSANNESQRLIQQQLESYSKVPDYFNYLAHIYSQLHDLDASIRAVAGLTLKNNLRMYGIDIHPSVLDYVKAATFSALADRHDVIRSTAGTLITTIVTINHKFWPDIIEKLSELFGHADVKITESAFSALQKLAEDSARILEDFDPRAIHLLIPKLIQFMQSPSIKIKVCALCIMNQFVTVRSDAAISHLPAFVNVIYSLTSDPSPDVRKNVCQAIVIVMEARADVLLPQLNNVIDFMLFCSQDSDEVVALEASEFWLAFTEQDNLHSYLQPYLPKVVPVLLKNMVYSDTDIILLGGDEDDAAVPDREEDIKPRHHKAKTHQSESTESVLADRSTSHLNDLDDDDEYYDDDEDDEDDGYGEWNVRKCSAASLDVLSSVYGNDLLASLLPHLKEVLFSNDWIRRESGILALGAISEGCMEGMIVHLDTLIPILINSLSDSKPLVRSIACWTLGRYGGWIVKPPLGTNLQDHHAKYFQPLIAGLLSMVVDNNKKVQESGCSALATIEEDAEVLLVPFLEQILMTFAVAFTKYQHKNMLVLYDAVGTLADAVGSHLNDPKFVNIIMPPLTQKWAQVTDYEHDIFPLLECLSSVAVALGPGFQPFAPPVWQRCLRLIQNTITQMQHYNNDPDNVDEPDHDFMVVAMDLLSGMIQGLGAESNALISSSNPPLIPLIAMGMKDPIAEVRQSSFALLGDLASSSFEHVRAHVDQFMPDIIQQIRHDFDPMDVSVCNNAAWSAGEIALQYGEGMQKWVHPLLERLIPMLLSDSCPRALAENAAISIGRLGLILPTLVAPHLEIFLVKWTKVMAPLRDNAEKESAYHGLCRMIEINPNGAVKHLRLICESMAAFQKISPELNGYFGKILMAYRQMLADQWAPMMSGLTPQTQQRLAQRYAF